MGKISGRKSHKHRFPALHRAYCRKLRSDAVWRSKVEAAVASAARADAVKVEINDLARVAGAKCHGEMAEHLLVLEVLFRQGLFAGMLPGPALVLLAVLFLSLGLLLLGVLE